MKSPRRINPKLYYVITSFLFVFFISLLAITIEHISHHIPINGMLSDAKHYLEPFFLGLTGAMAGYLYWKSKNNLEKKLKKQKQDLITSEERYRLIFNQSTHSIIFYDNNGSIKEFNNATKKVFGFNSIEDLKKYKLFNDPNIPDNIKAKLIKGEPTIFTSSFDFDKMKKVYGIKLSKSGIVNLKISFNPLKSENDSFIGYLSLVEDVSSEIKAQEAINNSNNEYRTLYVRYALESYKLQRALHKAEKNEMQFKNLFNLTFEGILIHENGIVKNTNQAFVNMFGYTMKELIGKNIINIIVDKKHHAKIRENLLKHHATPYEVEGIKKDGTIIPIELESKNIGENNRVAAVRDLSYRKLADQKILNTIIKTEEKERKKFAEDLHDELGPHMSGIRLYASTLKKNKQNENYIVKTAELIDEMVKEAIEKTRSISNMLMPNVLTDYGINTALNSFCKRISNTSNIKINLQLDPLDKTFDEIVEITLYRIIIELINNTIKHAKASNITIILKHKNQNIELKYNDDGIGFNFKENINKGLGLRNIKSRLDTFESNFIFNSTPGKGIEFNLVLQTSKIHTNAE